MELIAGETREILLALAIEDWAGLRDRGRFAALLSLAGVTPTWLDRFSQAARAITDAAAPPDFGRSCRLVEGPVAPGEPTVERIDRAWLSSVAELDGHDLDRLTAHWIRLLERDIGPVPSDDKPLLRALAGEIVGFARAAENAPDVLLSLGP